MRNLCEDQDVYKYAYVFKDEAIGAFENDKLILFQAPAGTDVSLSNVVRLKVFSRSMLANLLWKLMKLNTIFEQRRILVGYHIEHKINVTLHYRPGYFLRCQPRI